ncbi:DUF3500 domain-containing protein [Deinococcus sonorensis]|uniref:DUF3500 domain-containing protein n=2 Tax=Deinococcus sonorensis TaxID=309891 RepID=A0AAU7U6K8_9DEIO
MARIKDRLGLLNANDLAVKMAEIQHQACFPWYGPVTAGSAASFRVRAPTAIIEFSPQANDGEPTNHLHHMYRHPTNESSAG